MNQCRSCQQTWPMYYYHNHRTREKPEGIITDAWLAMPESKRSIVHTELTKVITKRIRSFVYERPPSAYQVFLKCARTEYPEVGNHDTFGSKTKQIASIWRSLKKEEKSAYRQQSENIIEQRAIAERALPLYMRLYIQKLRSAQKNIRRKSKGGKRLNGFMKYLRDRWKDEEQSELTYRQVMKIAAHEWNNTISSQTKARYNATETTPTQT